MMNKPILFFSSNFLCENVY